MRTDPTGEFFPLFGLAFVGGGTTTAAVGVGTLAGGISLGGAGKILGTFGLAAIALSVPGDTPSVGTVAADRPWRKPARWKVITRCNVNMQPGCDDECPATIGGWAYGATFRDAEKLAQRDANANLGRQGFRGCQARHCDPVQCFENGRQVSCPRGRPRVR